MIIKNYLEMNNSKVDLSINKVDITINIIVKVNAYTNCPIALCPLLGIYVCIRDINALFQAKAITIVKLPNKK